jgi:hypothetical protein
LTLNHHTRGKRRIYSKASNSIIALAVAENWPTTCSHLHLGTWHQALKPHALAALIEVAHERHWADRGRLRLNLDCFRRRQAGVNPNCLRGGHLVAAGERCPRVEREDLVGPKCGSLCNERAVSEHLNSGAGKLPLDAHFAAAFRQRADHARRK